MLKKLLLAVAVAFSAPASAHPLQDFVNQLKTYEADFSQELKQEDVFMSVQAAQKGHFELQRPGKLVWDYSGDDTQKIIVDGINIWVWDRDLDQVTVRPVAEIKADIPLNWLLFEGKIEDKFTIIDAGDRKGLQWYNLMPKQATYFQSIEIGLKDGIMQEVWLYEGPEKITVVELSNIRVNQPINASEFEFVVPQGVDLIGRPY